MDVAGQLLAAVERCLEDRAFEELSLRDIGAAAGYNESTIAYYFLNKDGLFNALTDRVARELAARLNDLEQNLDSFCNDPTRELLNRLLENGNSHPGVCRVLFSERLKKNSAIKEFYRSKYDTLTITLVERIIRQLISRGIYDPHMNIQYAAVTIAYLATSTIYLMPTLCTLGFTPDDFRSDAWLDHVTDLIDRKYRIQRL